MKLKLIDINKLLERQYEKQTNKYWGLIKKIIAHPNMLLAAYNNLKNKSSVKQTQIVVSLNNNETLQCIKNTANALKTGTFTFKSTQNIFLFKNKELKQTVTINNIVQEAIYMVLKIIYEYEFLRCSPGICLDQNPHINLKIIKNTWKPPSWWLKINLRKQFDAKLQRKVLFTIIRSKIIDQNLENILNLLLNNNILNLNFETSLNKKIKTPNSKLSILLLNIYLHKLDLYIINQKKEIEFSQKNPSSNKIKTPNFYLINYTRYATTILLAISGPKWLTLFIHSNIQTYLKSNLHVSQNTTEIIYAKLDWINYLGVRVLIKKEKNSIQIQAPLSKILNKLKNLGITQLEGKPRRLSSIIRQTDEKIIKWFSNFAIKLITYYRCCDNFHSIKKYVNYHLRWSCYHTLANKFKTTITKIIKKYDKNLIIIKNKQTLFYFPTIQKIKNMNSQFLTKEKIVNPI